MKKLILAAFAAVTACAAAFGAGNISSLRSGDKLPASRLTYARNAFPSAPNPFAFTAPAAPRLHSPYRAASAPRPLPGGNTVLCGAKVYSDKWAESTSSIDAGFYNIQARPGGSISLVKSNTSLTSMRAGVKVGSTYYAVTTGQYDETAYLRTFYASTMSQASSQEIDVVNVPSDLTYDPSTGNVYGCFYNSQTQDYDRFCSFNLYYGEATDIYTVERNVFAIAANSDGEIYGIMGYTGWLVRFYHSPQEDPAGYGYEYIGRTGFAPGYLNSMAFDDATGKLYWCANAPDGYSALLEVDTATGAATEIMHFDDNATFVGVFAQPYKVPDEAPAAPTAFSAAYTAQGALTGTLGCTAPVKTYNGATLTGTLSLVFSIDGVQVAQVDDAAPGAAVVTPEITFPSGAFTAEVYAANQGYSGAVATLSGWAGEDSPGPVTGLTLTDADGIPTLSWTAPQQGLHGQWFDPQGVTYTVVRHPDNHTVTGITTTSWADTAPDGMKALWYSVIAVNASGESTPADTPKQVFGDGFSIPFLEEFGSTADFDLWKLYDLNGNTTWVYDGDTGCVSYSYGTEVERAGDDWLISPKFTLRSGVTYALLFSAKARYSGYAENFHFMLGSGDTPADMTQLVCDRPGFNYSAGFKDERVMFTVPADGEYYLGLHCYSPAHNWTLFVDNIGIMEVSAQVPAPVASLTVTPGERGALTAAAAFTAPSAYASGDPMTSPVSVSLRRSGSETPVKVWNDVAPGTALTFDDTLPAPDSYTYTAVVSNSYGDSQAVETSAFIGEDIPGPVRNLRLAEDEQGTVTLTWDAPDTGANGGWFNPDGILYRVMRSSDAQELTRSLSATTYTDSSLGLESQQLVYYLVWPLTASGRQGAAAYTPLNLVLGPSLQAPVTESFAGANMALYPWTDESDGSVRLWTLENQGVNPPCADQNADRGLAMCIATADTKGLTGSLLSPKISVASLAEPQLSFWFYHSPSPAGAPTPSEWLKVQVSADHSDFTDIPGSTVYRDNGTTGWRRYTLDLSPWKDAGFIRLAFVGKSEGIASMYIDNIAVENARVSDLEVTSFSGPSRLAQGVQADFRAILSNLGAQEMNGVTVAVEFAGEAVSPALSVDLPAASALEVTLPVTVQSVASGQLTVTASHPDDSAPANNTASRALAVVTPQLPAPSALRAASDGLEVSLQWDTPAASPVVTDDLESYTDYAIDNIGDYLLVDRDWGYTYYINMGEGREYPDMQSPKSFQLLNAALLGIDIWSEGQPHSGSRFLGAISSLDRANDDWLISPRLNGAAQAVSFWAKSMTLDGIDPERMRVLYSTGSTDPDDFIPLHAEQYIALPDTWTQFRYLLPEGARYFAINCVSHDSFMLMVDDLAFNDLTVLPSEVTAYELYRDGALVAALPSVDGTLTASATDLLPAPGSYTYRVRAIFGDTAFRESPDLSVTVTESGLGTVRLMPGITAVPGHISVKGAEGLPVTVTLPDGRCIFSARAASPAELIPAAPGLYLVTAGPSAVKLIVP